MGGHYGSTHIRIDSNEPVQQILAKLSVKEGFKCYLAPPINGWVGVYNNGCGQEPIGDKMAKCFSQDILSVLVHDDDIFCYWYYKKGKLIDHYNSCPDYFGETLSSEQLEECKAHPEVFQDLLVDPKMLSGLQRVLNPEKKETKTNLPQDVMQHIAKMEAMSKSLDKFIHDPIAIIEFIKDNEQGLPPNDKLREFMIPLIKQKKSFKEIQAEAVKHPELMRDFISSLLTRFTEQKKKELDQTPSQVSDEMMTYQESEFLFASDQMVQFTDLLGIKNSLTSYEYLESGETENIEQFEDFIKIP